jgi:hypothetical protein
MCLTRSLESSTQWWSICVSSSNPSSSSSPSSPSPSSLLGPATEVLFKTEFFEVRPSSKGGYGAFATKNILKDMVVMIEEALFTGTIVEVVYQFEQLIREQQKEYMRRLAENNNHNSPWYWLLWRDRIQ